MEPTTADPQVVHVEADIQIANLIRAILGDDGFTVSAVHERRVTVNLALDAGQKRDGEWRPATRRRD